MSGARAAVILTLALGLAPRAAHAVYQCGDQKDDCQCGMSDPYPCCDNGGNCTWWAWEAACCNWAVGLPGWGNANQWRGNALAHPDYDVIDHPVTGSIANRLSGTYGHVAWVVGIDGLKLTVTEENCCSGCNYGLRTHTYSDWHYFDGGFIIRHGQCACTPGQTDSQACGKCGHQQRACGDDCAWGGWGSCTGEGTCAPAQTETTACGDCGEHSRTCDGSCAWGTWGDCAGPDPGGDGGAVACDTGLLGVCRSGVSRCVAGTLTCAPTTTASAEVCDGLDNDCNGETDEGGACPDAGPPHAADGGAASGDGGRPRGDGGAAAGDGLVGGCGCGAGPTGAVPAALLALGVLATRRRRATARRPG